MFTALPELFGLPTRATWRRDNRTMFAVRASALSRSIRQSWRALSTASTSSSGKLVGRPMHGTIGSAAPTVLQKDRIKCVRMRERHEEEVLVLGGACSEIVTGAALAEAGPWPNEVSSLRAPRMALRVAPRGSDALTSKR